MKVTGYFPYGVAPIAGANVSCYQHPGHFYPPSVELSPSQLHSYINSRVQEAITRDSGTFWSGDLPELSFGPYWATLVGEPEPTPPTKFIEGPQVRVKHENFKKRVAQGEIIVSPFAASGAYVSYHNGSKITPIREGSHTKHMRTCGLWEIERVANADHAREGSIDIPCQPFVLLSRLEEREYKYSPYSLGWNDQNVVHLLEEVSQPSLQDDHFGLILETVSDANKGALDYATGLAELPETVKSIIDGIMFILKMYKDARKGEVRLRNKVKRITASSKPHAQKLKDIKEVNDAISDIWLNWRYNIYPTTKLIEDAYWYLHDGYKDFRRYAHRVTEEIKISNYAPDGWVQDKEFVKSDFNTFIKRSYSDTSFSGLGLSFGTLYELVPASFMVDWFINLGDLIFAYFSPKLHLEEGATISWKYGDTITWSHHETGARVSALIKGYRRLVINPSDYCRLILNPDLNLLRQLDTITLAWKVFVRDFKSFKGL